MELEKTTFLELFLEAFGSQFRSVWPPRGSRRVPWTPTGRSGDALWGTFSQHVFGVIFVNFGVPRFGVDGWGAYALVRW